MKGIYKAGTTQLSYEEAKECYENKKYICNYSGIYQAHYSTAQKDFNFSKCLSVRLAPRGRFYALTAAQINYITKMQLLTE
jgi:hypothetical protein